LEVAVSETHPELGLFQGREILAERLKFFMVHAVDIVGANLIRTGEGLLERHCRRRDKLAILPVTSFCADFTDVDLRIEVSRKGIAMIATIDINNVEAVNFIKIMFGNVGSKDIGSTRIEARTQQCHEARFAETLLIGPLPFVFKLCIVPWFI